MAETKSARARSSRSTGGRSKRSRTSSNGRRASTKARGRSRAQASRDGKAPPTRARKAASSADGALSTVTDKAKSPVVAGGAALAAGAGGAVLISRKGVPSGLPGLGKRPSTVKLLGKTAKAIGVTGYKVGELTAELRKVREEINKD